MTINSLLLHILFFLLLTSVASFVTWFFYKTAIATDHPNERSSHLQTTPRSGGVAIVVTFLIGMLIIQEEQKRTIVFISHDLDEAMRIGDRIAIMEGGRVVQIGTPEDILQNPADDYVRAFFRGVDPTHILTAGDIVRDTQVTLIRHPGHGLRAALERLSTQDRDYGYVLDARKRFVGVVSSDSLKEAIDLPKEKRDISDAFLEGAAAVNSSESMQEILPLITAHSWPVPVVDDDNRYLGVVSRNIFLKSLQRAESEISEKTNGEVS